MAMQHLSGVTRLPLFSTARSGRHLSGDAVNTSGRFDGGIHAADTPDRCLPDLECALNGLYPHLSKSG